MENKSGDRLCTSDPMCFSPGFMNENKVKCFCQDYLSKFLKIMKEKGFPVKKKLCKGNVSLTFPLNLPGGFHFSLNSEHTVYTVYRIGMNTWGSVALQSLETKISIAETKHKKKMYQLAKAIFFNLKYIDSILMFHRLKKHEDYPGTKTEGKQSILDKLKIDFSRL